MKKKFILTKKIDLLIISLEALDIYQIEKISTQTKIQYNSLIINLIRFSDKIKYNNNNDHSYNFIIIIIYIYKIYQLIQNNFFHEITLKILSQYNKYQKPKELIQYIKKFTYIYFIKNEYYYNYKCMKYLHQININEIAIKNIYIINQIINKKGIYFLIKYLYT
uniref:Uncharacterized protein n=1 Tax=Sonderella linearis TaxID=110477 RepID=A0A1Z1MM07_9FLOR|nr:hypothetical protein [Sonderella linearis]ARW67130.1 hypothetical protein [Sonderella linearis]